MTILNFEYVNYDIIFSKEILVGIKILHIYERKYNLIHLYT